MGMNQFIHLSSHSFLFIPIHTDFHHSYTLVIHSYTFIKHFGHYADDHARVLVRQVGGQLKRIFPSTISPTRVRTHTSQLFILLGKVHCDVLFEEARMDWMEQSLENGRISQVFDLMFLCKGELGWSAWSGGELTWKVMTTMSSTEILRCSGNPGNCASYVCQVLRAALPESETENDLTNPW